MKTQCSHLIVLVLLSVGMLSGCAIIEKRETVEYLPATTTPIPEMDESLLDTRWSLESLSGQPLILDSKITISFATSLEPGIFLVSGNAGCNGYFIEATLEGGKYRSLGGIIHEVLCLDEHGNSNVALMAQEEEYNQVLRTVTGYEVSGEQLMLKNDDGEVVLVFQIEE